MVATSYDRVEDALADFEAVTRRTGTSPGRTTSTRPSSRGTTPEGRDRSPADEHTRHSTGAGFGRRLAIGAVAALFPAVGVLGALAAAAGGGAALGALAGHAARVLSRDDLKALGEVLDRGDAGLVIVYGPDMADRVATGLTRAGGRVDAAPTSRPRSSPPRSAPRSSGVLLGSGPGRIRTSACRVMSPLL